MGFQMVEKILTSGWPRKVKGQGQNTNNFEVEYLQNGTR